jgi:DNA replication initiation complex subunit (GINS family)
MLTFETLSRIVREEKSSTGLTKLPEDFFEGVGNYLSKKSRASEGKDDAWELENAKMVLGDIMKARERKVMTAALTFVDSGMEPLNLATQERLFFDQAASMVMQFRSEKRKFLEPGQERKSMVAFLEDVPEFVGTDMKNYGPFAKGDIANLPEDVTLLLIGKGAAKAIDSKPD